MTEKRGVHCHTGNGLVSDINSKQEEQEAFQTNVYECSRLQSLKRLIDYCENCLERSQTPECHKIVFCNFLISNNKMADARICDEETLTALICKSSNEIQFSSVRLFIIRVIQSRRIIWARHVARMGEM